VADQILMQKYGIDQGTMVALKQIKQSGKFKWDEFLGKLVGGAVVGGTTIAGAAIGGPAGAAGGAAAGSALAGV
jgi:outer membrane lipoprotein SlyB